MKRIGIDCRLAGQRHAGIGRYTQNLVKHLVEKKDVQWVLFFSDTNQAREIIPQPLSHVREVIVPVKHYSLMEQLLLPVVFSKEKLDLLHIPHFNIPIFYPGKIVITIHDLLWHEQRGSHVTTLPAWKYWLKYLGYKYTVQRAVQKAKHIFVPSKTVSTILKKYYPFVSEKITITYEGIAETFFSAPRSSKTPQIKKQLIYIGSLYPHKNIEVVLKALQKLPDFTLKLVGSRNIFQEETRKMVTQLHVEKQVEFLGLLSDHEVCALYAHSYALIFPSLSEGFGLPGLEAMAAGLPVIASDIPIFHEMYGEAAAFFDPHSPDELREVVRVLEPSRKILQEAGKKHAAQFHWKSMADKTYEKYLPWLQK